VSAIRPITIGISFPAQGSEAIDGRASRFAVENTVAWLNAQGGLLGRKVRAAHLNVNAPDSPDEIQRLQEFLAEEEPSVVIGCQDPACVRDIATVVVESGSLFIYPFEEIGIGAGDTIFTSGSLPDQLLTPPLAWAAEKFGSRMYLVLPETLYGRVAREVLVSKMNDLDLTLAGEIFLPLDFDDPAEVVAALKDAHPDVVLNIIRGDGNVALYKALFAAGLASDRLPTLFFRESHEALEDIGWDAIGGNFVAGFYDPSVRTKEMSAFKEAIEQGPNRGLEADAFSQQIYSSVMLWAAAVRAAGSTNSELVARQFRGLTIEGPSGRIEISTALQHPSRRVLVTMLESQGDMIKVWEAAEPRTPTRWPEAHDADWWERFVADLHQKWGGSWWHSDAR
jgi:urea transport system substrate-binding protein